MEALKYEYLVVLVTYLLTQEVQVVLDASVRHIDRQKLSQFVWTVTGRQAVSWLTAGRSRSVDER